MPKMRRHCSRVVTIASHSQQRHNVMNWKECSVRNTMEVYQRNYAPYQD